MRRLWLTALTMGEANTVKPHQAIPHHEVEEDVKRWEYKELEIRYCFAFFAFVPLIHTPDLRTGGSVNERNKSEKSEAVPNFEFLHSHSRFADRRARTRNL